MDKEEINRRVLAKHPSAPICKGCGCALVGNEQMWMRVERDIYCCAFCERESALRKASA